MSLSSLLVQAQPRLAARFAEVPTLSPGHSACILFFSFTDGTGRAHICRGAGADFSHAWQDGIRRCQSEAKRRKLVVRWLRIDRVTAIESLTWGELSVRLSRTKRNYFRFGLSLDAELKHAFLEPELGAHAMLYPGSDTAEAGLNEKNFTVHARQRFGQKLALDFSPDAPVWLFAHEGAFFADDPALAGLPGGQPDNPGTVWLPGPADTQASWQDPACLNAGHRQIASLQADEVFALIDSSANFLARQVQKSGQFIYGHFPCFGRTIATYNALRHASSVYSMLEAWELTRDDTLLAAIRRALDYLVNTLIRHYPQADGGTLAFNVDINGEIKLGANAVSLLALVKYDELTGDTRHRPLMEALALGIAHMQNTASGKFVHVLNAEDLSVKEAFRIVYYDGEAAFGLMRLYGLTQDPRWLAIVERAFDYFVQADHWQHHDHWLSYCANELTLYKPEEKYFRFGVQNVAGYLDFILQRETTYPTLLELAMAFEAMLTRIERDHPHMRHVLEGLDIDKFHRALHHRAHYLLNGFFWPELAMYFAKPQTVLGSFFIRHHTFRVRIDDIEHYLSGYVAYWKMMGRGADGGGRKKQLPAQEMETPGPVMPSAQVDTTFDRTTVGVLGYPASPKGFREVETYAEKAAQYGIGVIYLSYRNPRIESGRLAGYRYEQGQWRSGLYPLPAIIDNAPPRDAQEKGCFERLGAHAFMTCNKLPAKNVTLPILATDERSQHYAIPSAALSVASLRQFLDDYGSVIVKPVRSNRGRNVFLLRRCAEGQVELVTSESRSLLEEAALNDFANSRSESAWLVQRYIPSVDPQGRAFDVRVALFRAHRGEWRIARSYARLGANAVTSNLATGGSALDAAEFLATLYPPQQARTLTQQLEEAAFKVAEVLQAHYPFVIDALGCDFGVANGEIHLFEVNSYPGIKGCLQAATDAKVAFHRSLLQTLQDFSSAGFRNTHDLGEKLAKLSQDPAAIPSDQDRRLVVEIMNKKPQYSESKSDLDQAGEGFSYPFTFEWSPIIENFFREKNIFLKHPFMIGGIYKPGDKVTIKAPILIEPYAAMSGKNGFMNCGAFSYLHSNFAERAHFGRYCSVAPGSRLMGKEHPLDRISTHVFTCREYFRSRILKDFGAHPDVPAFEKTDRGPVVVENDVWIAKSMLIRPGVKISNGAVIAAGAVVTKDVPPFAIVGGNPARVIRYRFDEKTIERVLRLAWWKYHCSDFAGMDVADPHRFLDELEVRIENGVISPYLPEKVDIAREIHALLRGSSKIRPIHQEALAMKAGAIQSPSRSTFAIDAATPENQAMLRRVMMRGENDFSKSPFLKEGLGNPVYAVIAHEARQRGWRTKIVKNTHVEILDGDRRLAVFSPNTPNLIMASRKLTEHKPRTKRILSAAGVPVPSGGVFADFDRALAYFRIRKNPQVVKPAGGSGGKGVTAGVRDEVVFAEAWKASTKHGKKIIVEDFAEGDEVRLIVLGGELLAAVCRVPAYVIGDGRHSIRELVEAKNLSRRNNPLMRVYPINSFDYLLQVSRRSLDYIPKAEEYVRLATVSNVGLGGEAVSLIDELHPSFRELARHVFDAIPGATQLGLDVIARDFTSDAFVDNAVVIEVNSDPAIGTPRFAAWGPPAEKIAVKLLDFVARQANEKPVQEGCAPAPALSPAPVYRPACAGDSFPRAYGTQMRILRQAAYARGFAVDKVDAETTIIHHAGRRHLFFQGMSDGLLVAARRASNDKEWTKRLLTEAGVNTPQGGLFSPEAMPGAWTFACQLGLPVVIKPLAGSGGKGISTHIRDREHFERAWEYACASKMPKIIVETCHDGNDYRVVVIGESLVAAAQRIPAHVTGDGVHTIEALVELKNIQRRGNPHHGAKPIVMTPSILRNLEGLGLSPTSVLPAGQRVLLQYVANIGGGGESVDVTDQVHPAWAEIAVRARRAVFDAPHVGLDLIAEDIALAPDQQRWVIIEVNTNPDFGANHFPMHGQGRDVAGALLDHLFGKQAQPEQSALLVTVLGKVQGVGYRQWAWQAAHLRSLHGWVRNQADGSVQLLLAGAKSAVEDMLDACRNGPPKARVSNIDSRPWLDDQPEGFEIVE